MDYSKLTLLLEQLKIRVRDVKEALRALERLEVSRGESDRLSSEAVMTTASNAIEPSRSGSGTKAKATGMGLNGKSSR